MSVLKSDRDTSEIEFLNNARKLEIFTIQKCVSTIPKRYTFYIGNHLADSAHAIYSNAVKGNSIYQQISMKRKLERIISSRRL